MRRQSQFTTVQSVNLSSGCRADLCAYGGQQPSIPVFARSVEPMKRIVAFIMPVSTEVGAAEPPDADAAEISASSEQALADGAMRIEATVSDSRAQRIVATLLEQDDENADESTLDRLLEKEIHVAGPEAQDLFKRIVIGVERELICRVYSECNHVKTRAAARLGIDRNTLHKKLRQHHLAED